VRFQDREHAGRLLADRLTTYKAQNPLVLAIPRGGVPMAQIIADSLVGELDVVLVHKLGHSSEPELAIGAVDESGDFILLDYFHEVAPEYLEAEKNRQLDRLGQRRRLYTPLRAPINCHQRIVIVVDDGVATGSTMTAALRVVRARRPAKLIAAVGVASPQAAHLMEQETDAFVCLNMPAHFHAVGQFFKDFSQVSDEAVIRMLGQRESKVLPIGRSP